MPSAIAFPAGPDLLSENASRKIYTVSQIRVATFFGGPLAATYMIAENLKQFGEPGKARRTWIYGICISIVYHMWMLALHGEYPGLVFLTAITSVFVSNRIVSRTQGNHLQTYVSRKGKTRSGWKVFSVIMTAYILVVLASTYVFYAVYAHIHRIATSNQPSDS